MIQQFDREGNLVDEFSTAHEAAMALGIDKSNIYKVIKGLGGRKYAGGYQWVDTNCNTNETKDVGDEIVPNIPELDLHLKERGIDKKDVQSVKHWQSGSGEYRFSIVTKENKTDLTEFKKEFFEEMKQYIPQVAVPNYAVKEGSPVAYEISLPDFHYGKIGAITQEQANLDFLNTIKELHRRAKGLNIEKFILPIGNDGLNSEGYSRATTKGTPQQDAEEWQQTFRGYWKLLITAIDYLSAFAPVDVIVVQGNHDFERMFYIVEVIESLYRDCEFVTVDNNYDSRKYYRYGKNMLMFTHGDKEKPAQMPLLMATEQPLMFAECPNREVHCGHQHREIVNTYHGIKVRFLPSICTNDAWHKTMGYNAPREAQAYIWNKETGCEGYLQVNLK